MGFYTELHNIPSKKVWNRLIYVLYWDIKDETVNFNVGIYTEEVVGVCYINIDLYKQCWPMIW